MMRAAPRWRPRHWQHHRNHHHHHALWHFCHAHPDLGHLERQHHRLDGLLTCVAGGKLTYPAYPSPAVCRAQTARIAELTHTCGAEVPLVCGPAFGDHTVLGEPANCSGSAATLEAVVAEYMRAAVEAEILCTFGDVIKAVPASCDATAAALNAALEAFPGGSFGDCEITTPSTTVSTTATSSGSTTATSSGTSRRTTSTATTTATSSETSSVTTTVTTSGIHGQLDCFAYKGVHYLGVAAGTSCAV